MSARASQEGWEISTPTPGMLQEMGTSPDLPINSQIYDPEWRKIKSNWVKKGKKQLKTGDVGVPWVQGCIKSCILILCLGFSHGGSLNFPGWGLFSGPSAALPGRTDGRTLHTNRSHDFLALFKAFLAPASPSPAAFPTLPPSSIWGLFAVG